jgi:uncharacterized protein
MKLALFGAGGMIGTRILAEALQRGHAVTVVTRHPEKFPAAPRRVIVLRGDVLEPGDVAAAVQRHDAVVSAVGPGPDTILGAARALLEGLTRAGVKRLVVVGGAGSLEVAPGVLLFQTPHFPVEFEEIARAHADALHVFRRNDTLDWTVVSPPAEIAPGTRSGRYRLGGDQLLTDDRGASRIAAEDYAAAILDEVEKPRHLRQRFTVAY